jgi:DNA-binding transcriptional LysR family regulator
MRHAEPEPSIDSQTGSRASFPITPAAVEAGHLIRLLSYASLSRPMHILYAPDRRITPKLRSFIDFTVAQFIGLPRGA